MCQAAYGRREEAFGIHRALAGGGWRLPKPVWPPGNWLIVGKAMSGAFLAARYGPTA